MVNFKFWLLPILLFLHIKSISNSITVTGNVSGTWVTDTVLVIGNIEVPFLETLTIKEGTKVLFKGLYEFNVYGRLTANGKEKNEILFDIYVDGNVNNPVLQGWKGMNLISYGPENLNYYVNLKWCRFRKIHSPFNVAFRCDGGKTIIENCIFEDIEAHNLLYSNTYHLLKLNKSIFTNIIGSAILVIVGRPDQTMSLTNLTFVKNKSVPIIYDGVYRSKLKVTNCIFRESILDASQIYHYFQIVHRQYRRLVNLPDTSSIDASYSIFDPNLPVGNVSGNYSFNDPLFKNLEQRDFSLTWVGYPNIGNKSPAIDAGDPNLGMDADGTRPDIGAKIYFNKDRLKYSWANFSSDTMQGWGTAFSVKFNNYSYEATPETQYLWDFGDGFFSSEKSPTHQFTKRGIYDVKLVVSDPGGHKDSLVRKGLISFWGGSKVTESIVSGKWTKAGSPYYIYTDLKVPANEKFEITEGVEIIFPESHKMDVLGSFCVRGTANEPVRFYPSQIEKLKLPPPDTNLYDVQIWERSQGWSGINMLHSAGSMDSLIIEHGVFEGMRYYYGSLYDQYTGFHIENLPKVQIKSSTFRNIINNSDNKGIIFTIKNSRVLIDSCNFNNLMATNGFNAVLMSKCDSAILKANYFKDITSSAIRLDNSFGVTVTDNFLTGIRGVGIILSTERYDPFTNSRPWSLVNANHITYTWRAIACFGVKFRIFNNKILYNLSDSDPGLVVDGDSLLVYNNLIAFNSCTGKIGNLGSTAINVTTREPNNSALVFNNTIVGNKPNFYQPTLFLFDKTKLFNNIIRNGGFAEIIGTNGFNFAPLNFANNNNIAGGYFYGSGNADFVAGFADSAKKDFRLTTNSASIDKGYIPDGVADIMDQDFFGNPRPGPGSNLPDQGYAEYVLPAVQSNFKFVGSGSIFKLSNWENGKIPGFLPEDQPIQVQIAPESAGHCMIEGKLILSPGTVFQIKEGARVYIKE